MMRLYSRTNFSSSSRRAPSPPPGADPLTSLMGLISVMSIEDINDILSKRRNTSGPPTSDHDLALALFAEEAEGLLNVTKDHLFGGLDDDDLLDELIRIEETAQYDHAMAVALSQGREPPPRPPPRGRRLPVASTSRHTPQSSASSASPVRRSQHADGPRERRFQRGRSDVPSSSDLEQRSNSVHPPTPLDDLEGLERWELLLAAATQNSASPARSSSPVSVSRGSSNPPLRGPLDLDEVDVFSALALGRTLSRSSSAFGSESDFGPPPSDDEIEERSPGRSPVYSPVSSPPPDIRTLPDTPVYEYGRLPSPQEEEPMATCVVCGDEIEDTIIYAPCGDLFDASCLRTMFENAIKDESLFPPKCCQAVIELHNVEDCLDSALVDRFERKAREYRTQDRVYCHVPTCSAFLGSATEAPTTLACPECRKQTCGSCKAPAHRGRECRAEWDDAVLELGKTQHWQRCPACRHLVERTHGCNHMTCLCKKEFCYVCAKAWKGCACPLFEDVPDTADRR